MIESEPEVDKLTIAYDALRSKVTKGYEITLEEFKTIVVPYVRAHREEQFVLHVKVIKEKKITKKRVAEILLSIADNTLDSINEKEQEEVLDWIHARATELALGHRMGRKDRNLTISGLKWKETLGYDLDANERVVMEAYKSLF